MSIQLSTFQMIEMAVFDTSTLTSSFQPLNGSSSYQIFTGSGFPEDIKILKYINDSGQTITLSLDGITQNDIVLPGSSTSPIIINLQANHADNSSYSSGTLYGRQGQIIYGKGTPGAGNFYIIGFR